MGHFSETCLISRLPITGGTPIRVCLLTEAPRTIHELDRAGENWAFRSVPFRADYNDYGRIENVHPEDQVLVDLALAQFNQDLVELPWGDNLCHDVPVAKGMSEEDFWMALWEQRLLVREGRGYGRSLAVKVPKGVPTWKRVGKLVSSAETNGNLIPGTIADRVAYGIVRVRFNGSFEDEKKPGWLRQIVPILESRYKVTTRYEHGVESHRKRVDSQPERESWDVWLEVTPKDGLYPPINPTREIREQSLVQAIEHSHGELREAWKIQRVSWAFIREDVWQAVLPLGGPNYNDWSPSPTADQEIKKVEALIKRSINNARDSGDPLKTTREIVPNEYGEISMMDRMYEIMLESNPGYVRNGEDVQSLAWNIESSYPRCKSPPFVQGMAMQMARLAYEAARGKYGQSEIETMARAVGEFAVIRDLMATLCVAPIPTYSGSQDGAWEAHGAYHKAIRNVVESVVKEHTYDGEGET